MKMLTKLCISLFFELLTFLVQAVHHLLYWGNSLVATRCGKGQFIFIISYGIAFISSYVIAYIFISNSFTYYVAPLTKRRIWHPSSFVNCSLIRLVLRGCKMDCTWIFFAMQKKGNIYENLPFLVLFAPVHL